jgi:uncharacterized protein YndB with AHSA1/START domain
LTTWLLEAERERVWDAVYDSDAWPEWWRGVESAERLSDGDERGVGQRGRYVWRARLPYRVGFEIVSTVVERPRLLEGDASGELEGHGRWRLFEQSSPEGTPVTAVLYEWNVRSTKRWMNALAPLAGPAFRSNHDWVMRNGGTGIAERLGCRLLAAD